MGIYFGNKQCEIISNNTPCGLNLYTPMTGNNIVISDGNNGRLLNTKIYGKTVNVGVKTRQLFDANLFSTHSMGGATVVNNGDGSLTVTGSGKLTSTFSVIFFYSHDEVVRMFKTGEIHARFGSITYPFVNLYLEDKPNGKSLKLAQNGWVANYDATITEEMLASPTTQLVVGLWGDTGFDIIPGTTKPMIYQDGDATWEPFMGINSEPKLESIGVYNSANGQKEIECSVKTNQLYDTSKVSSFSKGGATVTNNGDGSFTITGSGNLTSDVGVDYRYSHEETVKLLKTGNIYSKYSSTSNPYVTFYLVNGGWNVLFTLENYSVAETTQVITEKIMSYPNLELLVAIYGDAGTPITPCTVKPMIYQDGDGKWQPFSRQYHVSSVGDGLRGIPFGAIIPETIAVSPIHMSGVYREDGQYWISDTVDYGKGSLIRRIVEKVYDGNTIVNQSTTNSSVYYFIIENDMHDEAPVQSDYYKYTQNSIDEIQNGECRLGIASDGSKLLYLCDTSCSTVNEMKALLSEKPVTVQYILETPVETPISESELTSYNKLCSYDGVTSVTNDCGAFMEINYNRTV